MIDNLVNIYEDMYIGLKEYLKENSKYSPSVYKKEPNAKVFPVVIMKLNSLTDDYSTLKYTDRVYNIDIEINIYAVQKNSISEMTICNEITNLIYTYFMDNYQLRVNILRNVPNIDSSVYRNQMTVTFKVDTRWKGKLVISPRYPSRTYFRDLSTT